MKMRRGNVIVASLSPGLRWTLTLSVLASAASLLTPTDPSGRTVRDIAVGDAPRSSQPTHHFIANIPSPAGNDLEDPAGDPFVLPVASTPSTPVVAPASTVASSPSAPPLNYRYLGQFIDPQGESKVYITAGGRDILVEVGMELSEGYRVEAITGDEIRLIYPPLQQRAIISRPLVKSSS